MIDTEKLENVPFDSLVGEHQLDAVDESTEQVKSWYGETYEDANCIRFRLDGKVYTAIEDPSDGYRSSMEKLFVSEDAMKNVFAPVRVLARIRTKYEYGGTSDVLQLVDMQNEMMDADARMVGSDLRAILATGSCVAPSHVAATPNAVLLDACREWQKHADHKDGLDNVESALYGAIVIALQQGAAPPSAIAAPSVEELQRIFREERVKQSYHPGNNDTQKMPIPTWTITFTDATVKKLAGTLDGTANKEKS